MSRRLLFHHPLADEYFEAIGEKAIDETWRKFKGTLTNVTDIADHEKEFKRRRKSAVVGGALVNVSVSQIAKFDPGEEGGCHRKWYREYVLRDKPPKTKAQLRGNDFHTSIEHYLKTGNAGMLSDRVLAGKHMLPAPGADLHVELQFGPDMTLHLAAAGVPLNGKIDLLHNRGRYVHADGSVREEAAGNKVAEVCDWKTTSNIDAYAKRAEQLVSTAQMVTYGVVAQLVYPHLEQVRLSHGYFQTGGARDSDKRSLVTTVDRVNSSWLNVESVVRSMKDAAAETDFLKVEPNFEACGTFGGCPYRAHCPRSAEQAAIDLFGKGKGMSLLRRPAAAAPPATHPAQTPTVNSPAARALAAQLGQPSAEVLAEAQRLAQVQAGGAPAYTAQTNAPEVPLCFYCGDALTPMNASRLQAGGFKHIGCKLAPADVLPPDAPKSQPHLAAQAVPPESIATLPPAVQAAVIEHAAAAAASTPPGQVEPAPRARGRRKAAPAVEHIAPQALAHVAHIAPAQAVHAPPAHFVSPATDVTDDSSGIGLFVNVLMRGLPDVKGLDHYLADLCNRLCVQWKAVDIRCAPDDSPLAYGKWKGALAALIRAEPPEPGDYLVHVLEQDELKAVLVQTVAEIADVCVRGIR